MMWSVDWSKTYYMSGTVCVEADTPEQAKEIVENQIGDYSGGSMQYDANEDYVCVLSEPEEK